MESKPQNKKELKQLKKQTKKKLQAIQQGWKNNNLDNQ